MLSTMYVRLHVSSLGIDLNYYLLVSIIDRLDIEMFLSTWVRNLCWKGNYLSAWNDINKDCRSIILYNSQSYGFKELSVDDNASFVFNHGTYRRIPPSIANGISHTVVCFTFNPYVHITTTRLTLLCLLITRRRHICIHVRASPRLVALTFSLNVIVCNNLMPPVSLRPLL